MFTRPYLALPALAGALLGVSVAAFAQSAEPPAGQSAPYATAPPYAQPGSQAPRPGASGAPAIHHRRHRSAMARALGGLALSTDQRAKIHDMMRSYRASRNTATPESRAQLKAQIENVLTPEERTTFETRLHDAHRPSRTGNLTAPTAAP